jgi:hypothetical protein
MQPAGLAGEERLLGGRQVRLAESRRDEHFWARVRGRPQHLSKGPLQTESTLCSKSLLVARSNRKSLRLF